MCHSLSSINKLYRNQKVWANLNFLGLTLKLKTHLTKLGFALYNFGADDVVIFTLAFALAQRAYMLVFTLAFPLAQGMHALSY